MNWLLSVLFGGFLTIVANADQSGFDAANATLSCEGAGPNTFYFPPGTFPGSYNDADEFRRAWYSKHLAAMQEPSLTCGAEGGSQVIRFLWLRTFHEPVAVRIDRIGAAYKLTATILDGAGGYGPGNIKQRIQKDITETEWAALDQLLNEIGFSEIPPYIGIGGLDGAQWIVERRSGDAYHVVDRQGGSDGIRSIGEKLLKLAGIVTPAREKY